MNEKGYSLVLTLLIITIFFMLGLTILSVSLYQAKFTQTRVEDVTSLHEATKAIEETIAEMKVKVENLELSTPLQLDTDLGNSETGFIKQLIDRYGVNIQDVTLDNKIDRTKLFTRVYLLSKPYGTKTVSRKIIITNTPSFLKYAVGSTEDVVLNGGMYIDGNIYAGKNFYVTNVANYIDNSQKYTVQTSFPTTSDKSVLFVNENRYSCEQKNGANACYNVANSRFERILPNYSNDVQFQTKGPSVQKEQSEFIDVDFDWTFKDKLLNAAGIETFSQAYENNINLTINELLNSLKGQFATFDHVPTVDETTDIGNEPILLDSDKISSFFIDHGELDLQNNWLIVNGDLYLGNSINIPVKIRGNILVLGNLMISGNVQLDSTIYALQRTFIYNANISGWNDKEVVLLSKGPLEIARINEFDNNFPFVDTPNLKGYFYTDSNAVLYAVGSYINIKGGLFARGNVNEAVPDGDTSGLVINSYRGPANKQNNAISLSPPPSLDEKEQARFVIQHDKSVFIDRGLGLPFVKKLDLIVDELTVK